MTIAWAALCIAAMAVGYAVGKESGQRVLFEEHKDLISIVQETQKEEAELIVKPKDALKEGKVI